MPALQGKFCLLSVFLSFALVLAVSCTMHASHSSFTGHLDEIDDLIEQGQINDALAQLKKAEKESYDSWSNIGIFRRYRLLGQNDRAEKVLKKALSRNRKNHELSAVYSNFLLREGRIDEAEKYGACLRGTQYGSIYSEAVLAAAVRAHGTADDASLFSDEKYIPVYYDAYVGSKESYWLRNCAVMYMTAGNATGAVAVQPSRFIEPEDAYFWALVNFDAARYGNSAELLETASELYPDASIKSRKTVSPVEIAALESDAYLELSDVAQAEKIRSALLSQYESQIENHESFTASDDYASEVLPVMFVNSAYWAGGTGDDHKESSLLSYAVTEWPDFVPALTLYADFAYTSSLPHKDTPQEMALRDDGIATLEMEKYDNRAKIPVSDAAYRMDESLKRKNDPLLYVARLDLKYKTDASLSRDDKIADLWHVLEKNMTGTDMYPPVMFDYAQHMLLSYGRIDDAWSMYKKYISSEYHFDLSKEFWPQLIENAASLSETECAYGGWFAANQRLADTALCLYEYAVYGPAGNEGGIIIPAATVSSCMNLAMIYNCTGQRQQALDLYNKTAGRTSGMYQKSEIMYRTAAVYAFSGDKHSALKSAEYAVTLNPENAKAKLLYDQLTAK